MGDLSKNFDSSEFACTHCGDVAVEQDFIAMLQLTREIDGKSMSVRSGCRCITHNRAIGSEDTSSHVIDKETGRKCCAVDIEATTSRRRWEIVDAAKKAGFRRIGIDKEKGFIHLDNDKSKAQDVIWIYT